MIDALLLAATGILATLGLAGLAFRQKQHWQQIQAPGSTRRPPAWLAPASCALLALSSAPAIVRDGPAFGFLVWLGTLTIAAMAVASAIAALTIRRNS